MDGKPAKTARIPCAQQDQDLVWSPGKHIAELDGVRGLAILLVTFYRFGKHLPDASPLGQFIHSVVELGSRGVDLFFVLSGFLITGILVDSRQSQNYFSSFYIRRTLRIFPLYYAALLLFLVVIPAAYVETSAFAPAIAQQGYLWAYASNIHMAWVNDWCFGPMDHFWSLAVEEHFYLIWPLVIYALSPKNALRMCIALAILSFTSRTLCGRFLDARTAVDVLTVFRLEGLCLGAALAIWLRSTAQCEASGARHDNSNKVVLLVLGSIAALAICINVTGRSYHGFGHTLWACVCVGMLYMLAVAPKGGVLARFFASGILRHFGKYSYAMYVFQAPLIPLLSGVASVSVLSQWTGEYFFASALHLAVMFLATWGCALWSWQLLERHALSLKNHFENGSLPTTQPGKKTVRIG